MSYKTKTFTGAPQIKVDNVRSRKARIGTVDADQIEIWSADRATRLFYYDTANGRLEITDLHITGDLTADGTGSIIDMDTIEAKDSLMKLNSEADQGAGSDNVDIGFFAVVGGTTDYAGFYRDATDGIWKFSNTISPEPTTAVTSGAFATVQLGTLTADTAITVAGTNVGSSLSDHNGRITTLETEIALFNDELQNLTAAEIQQLQNIGTSTISAGQWAYLGAMDQGVATTDTPTFNKLVLTKDANPTMYFGSDTLTGLTSDSLNTITMIVANSTQTEWNLSGFKPASGVQWTASNTLTADSSGLSLSSAAASGSDFTVNNTGGLYSDIILSNTGTPRLRIRATGDTEQCIYGLRSSPLKFGTNDASQMELSSSGSLGIGDTANAQFEVFKSYSGTGLSTTAHITNTYSSGSGVRYTDLAFRLTDSVGTNKDACVIQAVSNHHDVFTGANLVFMTRTADSTPTEKMRLDKDGNLGIGGTPSGKLDVVGSAGTARIETTGDTLAFTKSGTNYLKSAGSFDIQTNGANTAMTIGTGGDVQIKGSYNDLYLHSSDVASGQSSFFIGFAGSEKCAIMFDYINNFFRGDFHICVDTAGDGNAVALSDSKFKIDGQTGEITMNDSTYSSSAIEINDQGSGNRYAFIDFHGDDTYTDYSFRIIRQNGGANTTSEIVHRGTGDLIMKTVESADIVLKTGDVEKARLDSDGNLGLGTTADANYRLHVHGDSGTTNGEVARFTTNRGASTVKLDLAIGSVGVVWDALNTSGGFGVQWNMDGVEKMRLNTTGDLSVVGALSKGSGSFDIPHVVPEKKAKGMRLRHYFVESNTAGDNLYRYQVEIKENTHTIDLPDYFNLLNTNVQVWVNANKHFGQGYGEIIGDKLVITTNAPGIYNILVIGTRHDEIAMKDFTKHGLEYIPEA